MSDTDKTRQKLMDTIRRTKAGANPASEESSAAAPEPKEAAPKPAAAKSQAKPKSKPKVAPKRSAASSKKKAEQPTADPFQSSRRVWPD